jgi:hypothetical protein
MPNTLNTNLSNLAHYHPGLPEGLATLDALGIVTASQLPPLPANAFFQTGVSLPFTMASAPAGWVQDTSDNANNRMLRVVNTVGVGIGGTHSPILNNVVPSHTHTFTTGVESANHTHWDAGHAHSYDKASNPSQKPASSGTAPFDSYTLANTATGYAQLGTQSANHTHGGSTSNGSSQTNWTPRYIDLIVCVKS